MQIPNRVTHNQSTFPDTLESSALNFIVFIVGMDEWVGMDKCVPSALKWERSLCACHSNGRTGACARAVADNDNAILLLASHLDIEFIYFIIFVNDAFILCGFAVASNVDDDDERHFFLRSCCCS